MMVIYAREVIDRVLHYNLELKLEIRLKFYWIIVICLILILIGMNMFDCLIVYLLKLPINKDFRGSLLVFQCCHW